DHQPSVSQPDFGDQLPEAIAVDGAGAGLAEILVDDMHALARPAESNGAIDQAILQLGAFLMMAHLIHGGLAHVDVGQLAAMLDRDALVSLNRRRRRSAFASNRGDR